MERTATPMGRAEAIAAAACAIVLLWINLYVCRELFQHDAAHMNSMQGFWIALARLAQGSWWHANWWPYMNCGMPFEFAYAPLVPWLTAAIAAVRGVPDAVAFQAVTGLVYCAGPVTLFLMAWLLTRAPGYSFLAGLFYSLTAPTQLVIPDGPFSFQGFWSASRLMTAAVWDETPHLAALALLPVMILLLVVSLERRRPVYYAATALTVALMTLASDFGPVMFLMAALCLLVVLPRADVRRHIAITVGIGAAGYAVASPFLSPSLIAAIRQAAEDGGEGWSMGSLTALVIAAAGWILLWHYLRRWTKDLRLRFFALFAYLTASVPVLAYYLHRHFLPEPNRYKFEMELALSLLVVFGVRPWLVRVPKQVKMALALLVLALAGEQMVSHRQFAKHILHTEEATRTIEYRASVWAEQNLRGVRVMMGGSIEKWANAFTGVEQYSGGSWSVAANPAQQNGLRAMWNGGETAERDARVSLAWLKAYGVGAIAMSGPHSQEFWKPFAHPAKFEGILPVLWREDDVTIYRIPQRTDSLAHVVPAAALVGRAPRGPGDIAAIETYGAALDDASLPAAGFQWEGRNRIRIAATVERGQAVSVQVSYHPGWHATAGGRRAAIRPDGLGLMWLRPDCSGRCDMVLDYDGGWELRLCRYISLAALASLLLFPLVMLWRKRSVSAPTS